MLRRRSVALGCVALCVVALSTGAAFAQQANADEATRNAARALGTAGVRAYLDGDTALAKERLERSFDLLPTPTLGLWSARALAKLGLLVEASARYSQVSQLSVDVGDVATQQAAQQTAEQERSELVPRIPTLLVQIAGAPVGQVQVWIDGGLIDAPRLRAGVALNPGQHEVVARDERGNVASKLALGEAEHQTLELTFVPPPSANPTLPAPAPPPPVELSAAAAPAPPPLQPNASGSTHDVAKTAGWVGVGLGGAALATALVTYFVGLSQHEQLVKDPRCSRDVCEPSARDRVNGYSTLRVVNVAAWISAGVFSAAGVTLLLVHHGQSGDVQLTAQGSSLSLRGAF